MTAQQKKVLEDEVNGKGIGIGLLITVAVLVLIFVSFLAMGGLMRGFDFISKKMTPPVPDIALLPVTPPNPRLQVNPKIDLREKLSQERAQLNSYGWVDRQRGIAHIPIDRAIEMLAKSPRGQES